MSCIYICLVNQHSWAKNWTRQSSDILHNISSVCSVQSLTKPGYQADWELMGLYWVKSQRMQIKKKKKRKEHWTAVKKSWHFMMHQLLRKSYQKIYLLEISKEKYVPYSICHYWPNHRNINFIIIYGAQIQSYETDVKFEDGPFLPRSVVMGPYKSG